MKTKLLDHFLFLLALAVLCIFATGDLIKNVEQNVQHMKSLFNETTVASNHP